MRNHPRITDAKFLPCLLLALSLLPAAREARAAESAQDSAALNLSLYAQVVDSLQAAAAQVPKDSIVATKPCATTKTKFCSDDYPMLVDYLKTQKQFAQSIQARLRAGVLRYEDYLGTVLPQIHAILRKDDAFSDELAAHPILRKEKQAYDAYVFPLMRKNFLTYAVAANTLLKNKYFSQNDQGNFLEGFFNSRFGWTRTDPDPTSAGFKTFGVSPWEILMRVEPIYILGDNDIQNFGGVFSTGTIFHFFPTVTVVDDAQGSVKVRQTFASSVLQDMGFKLGIGAHSDKLHWSAGGAVQVAAFSLWGLYTWQEDRFDLALSLSDLAVVKALLPIYKRL